MRSVFLLIGILFLSLLFMFTNAWQFAKTIWLILEVAPYEQKGVGIQPSSILIIGDSTGYGTGAGDGHKSIAGLIGASFPTYAIVNNSKNGRTIGEALEEFKKIPSGQMYDLILFQLGGNDILQKRSIATVEGELRQLFTLAKQHSPHVVLLSCGNVGTAVRFLQTSQSAEYDTLTRQFRTVFSLVATSTGETFVDVFQEPAVDVFMQKPEVYFSPDGLHPSAAGYAVWYQSLGPVLGTLLK